MTAYFDQKGQALGQLRDGLRSQTVSVGDFATAIDQLESELVWDVSIASESPGFPEDLGQAINLLVLKRASACQPVNHTGPEFETPWDSVENLMNLIGDLHSVFHNLAKRNLIGFSDDPRSPLRVLYSRSEEKREAMAEAGKTSGPERVGQPLACAVCGEAFTVEEAQLIRDGSLFGHAECTQNYRNAIAALEPAPPIKCGACGEPISLSDEFEIREGGVPLVHRNCGY